MNWKGLKLLSVENGEVDFIFNYDVRIKPIEGPHIALLKSCFESEDLLRIGTKVSVCWYRQYDGTKIVRVCKQRKLKKGNGDKNVEGI